MAAVLFATGAHTSPGRVFAQEGPSARLAPFDFIESLRAQKVTFGKGKGGPTIVAPEGSIGSDLLMRNYAYHLITRYNDFAAKQPGRAKFSRAAIYSHIKKEYRVGKWELVPITRFYELCAMLQRRIDDTRLGSINRGKSHKNYSTVAEYQAEHFAPQPN